MIATAVHTAGKARLLVAATLSASFMAVSPPAMAQGKPDDSPTSVSVSASPAKTTSAPRVTLQVKDMPLPKVLEELRKQSGAQISLPASPLEKRRVTVSVQDGALDQVLQKLAEDHNWVVYRPESGGYELYDQESFRRYVLPVHARQKVFTPRSISAEEAAKAFKGLLTPGLGAVAFDPRSNKVIVTDTPYVTELMERLLKEIDVAYVTRVFHVTHADPEKLAVGLEQIKSQAAPRPIVDERTRQIIVRDRPEIIREMEFLVETLDIPAPLPGEPDLRTWKIERGTSGTVRIQAPGMPVPVDLHPGEPHSIPLAGGQTTTVTLGAFPDETGTLATFSLERPPLQLKARVR